MFEIHVRPDKRAICSRYGFSSSNFNFSNWSESGTTTHSIFFIISGCFFNSDSVWKSRSSGVEWSSANQKLSFGSSLRTDLANFKKMMHIMSWRDLWMFILKKGPTKPSKSMLECVHSKKKVTDPCTKSYCFGFFFLKKLYLHKMQSTFVSQNKMFELLKTPQRNVEFVSELLTNIYVEFFIDSFFLRLSN